MIKINRNLEKTGHFAVRQKKEEIAGQCIEKKRRNGGLLATL